MRPQLAVNTCDAEMVTSIPKRSYSFKLVQDVSYNTMNMVARKLSFYNTF